MTARIAYLTAAAVLPDHPNPRSDRFEHELQFPPLVDACARAGIELVACAWDSADWRIDSFDAVVVGTTWDYPERPGEFVARLQQIAAIRPLWNPLELITWNLDKGYLQDLARAGVPTVPTLHVDRVDVDSVRLAFERFDAASIVAKPSVGAGAWRQVRVERDGTMPPDGDLPPGRALLQPYLDSIESEGELSFVFLGGEFSHCVQKIPRTGDYRVQRVFGASERRHDPTRTEIDAARTVLRSVTPAPLYARVDMVRHRDRLHVMELELIEPYLYPEQCDTLGERFAKQVRTRL
ncbi:MAG: hypothetical protein KDB80_03560 [Planctomycetes bacterium]|nr:hypothetical protein [Planctomycetota bacterium]